ncbi:hypothetical protein AA106_02350 [Photorhabdus laumondii subsp. laumondii]|nr:hypothetical protein AA106_02350 [Photorhabdus laumondii subsp. laumondii]
MPTIATDRPSEKLHLLVESALFSYFKVFFAFYFKSVFLRLYLFFYSKYLMIVIKVQNSSSGYWINSSTLGNTGLMQSSECFL